MSGVDILEWICVALTVLIQMSRYDFCMLPRYEFCQHVLTVQLSSADTCIS